MSSSSERPGEPLYLALDLGSNSFHLLLATFRQGKMVRLDRRKEAVRLASGLGRDGQLSDEARQRALDTLSAFRPLFGDLPASHVRIVGTNTLRAAKNSESFLLEAERVLGYPIDIISGIEEARLIYLGVAKDLDPRQGPRLVIDIGGGSTEVVLGDSAPRELESLYMGCVSYSQRYFPGGEISEGAYRKAVRAARREVLGLAGQLRERPWNDVVGSSGTIRAIGSILGNMGYPQITLAGLRAIQAKILTKSKVGDLSLPGLSKERAAVLPGGAAILEGLFRELAIEAMDVSEYAIREGIVHDLAGRVHHRDKRQETLEGMMVSYHVDVSQAQRVGSLAISLWYGVGGQQEGRGAEMLRWAADLHEIGLAISHAGYQKHGAYVLRYADMPGFSRQEQELLSFLVLNHRRKLQRVNSPYGFRPNWSMVLCLRLACIFTRSRRDNAPVGLALGLTGEKQYRLSLDSQWLEEQHLVNDDLQLEAKQWKRLNYELLLDSEG